MSSRLLGELTLLCGLVVGLFVWLARAPTPPSSADRELRLSVLATLPTDGAVIVTLDAERLRQTDFGRRLLARGRIADAVSSLSESCATDPTERLREVALFVPKLDPDAEFHFAVSATGDFRATPLLECVAASYRERAELPVVAPLGGFQTLRKRGDSSGGEYAIRDGGPLLLADSRLLRELVDTVEGRLPNAHQDELHAALRRTVGRGAIVASAAIAEGFLVRATDLPYAAGSPLDRVRAAALRVDVAPVFTAQLVLGCESDTDAQAISTLIGELRRDLPEEIARVVGKDVLAAAVVSTRGRLLFLDVQLDEPSVARLWELLAKSEAGGKTE